MENWSSYVILLWVCGLVVLSYLFSIINRSTRIPSVLLLLATGMGARYYADSQDWAIEVPSLVIELLGTAGLIMIVLEAGLDLEINRSRLPIIFKAFMSALVIFLISSFSIAGIIFAWIPDTPFIHCLIYAIPLSIVSSAVVLTSVHHLGPEKKEFLIYEAAFSDIIGIMVFNFFSTNTQFGTKEIVWFGSSVVIASVLSVVICLILVWILVNNRIHIKFFLSFAVLTAIYVLGKILQLPSLITIMMFGIVMNNWRLFRWAPLQRYFTNDAIQSEASFLKSITAESSFLIRTFFFLLFGYGIGLSYFQDIHVLELGMIIVLTLFALRFVYLRVVHRYNLFPELFYIPRGLITVLLFYKIPSEQRIENFDEGVLFFVILTTSIIMMLGAIFHRDRPVEIFNSEKSDLL
jgi:hypothetical protein